MFFCTFLALRSQDNGPNPVKRITDENLKGEKQVFSGYDPLFLSIPSRSGSNLSLRDSV